MSHPHTLCIGASKWRKHSLCGGERGEGEGSGGGGGGGDGKGEGREGRRGGVKQNGKREWRE